MKKNKTGQRNRESRPKPRPPTVLLDFDAFDLGLDGQMLHVGGANPSREDNHEFGLELLDHLAIADHACGLALIGPVSREHSAFDVAHLGPSPSDGVGTACSSVADAYRATAFDEDLIQLAEHLDRVGVVSTSADEDPANVGLDRVPIIAPLLGIDNLGAEADVHDHLAALLELLGPLHRAAVPARIVEEEDPMDALLGAIDVFGWLEPFDHQRLFVGVIVLLHDVSTFRIGPAGLAPRLSVAVDLVAPPIVTDVLGLFSAVLAVGHLRGLDRLLGVDVRLTLRALAVGSAYAAVVFAIALMHLGAGLAVGAVGGHVLHDSVSHGFLLSVLCGYG